MVRMRKRVVLPISALLLLILGFMPVLPSQSGSLYSVAYEFFGIGATFGGVTGYSGAFSILTSLDALLFVGLPLLVIAIAGFIWAKSAGSKVPKEKFVLTSRDPQKGFSPRISNVVSRPIVADPLPVSSVVIADRPSVSKDSEISSEAGQSPVLNKSTPKRRTGPRKRKKMEESKELLVQAVSDSSSSSEEPPSGVA
jgi:hypothetical protein